MKSEITTYSDQVPGDRRNHNLSAQYDLTGGYIGITQRDGGKVKDRVLLSPKQVRQLVAFAGQDK